MLSLNLDHQVVMSAWEQMGEEQFDDAPLSVPEHFELDLACIEAGMHHNGPNDFCVPSPTSKGSHASDFDFPWSLQNVIVKQEQYSSFPEFKSSTAAPWQTSMMIPTSSLQPGNLQRAGSTPASDLIHVHIKQEQQEVPCINSPTSSSSHDAAVVPDVRRNAASSSSSNSSSAAVVPQSTPAASSSQAPSAPVPTHRPPPRPIVNDGEFVRTRQECLQRYREKKARRLYTKKIRYQLRKINADKRPRIKGRFVKKEELEEYMRSKTVGGQPCQELAAFSALAALELPTSLGFNPLPHDNDMLDPNMFDDDSSEFDQDDLEELGL